MLGLVSCLVFVYLTHWLIACLAAPFTFAYYAVWIGYFALSEYVEWHGWLHMPAWRRSRFAFFVGRTLYRSSFAFEFDDRWRQTIRPGSCMFILEPHGFASLHMVFGFAAHGGSLPPDIGDRTFVIGHWFCRFLPIIRNIFSAFGVIYSTQRDVERVLMRGDHIAVCASGIAGKQMSLRNMKVVQDKFDKYRYVIPATSGDHDFLFEDGSPAANILEPKHDTLVIQRSTTRLGCFAMAIRHCVNVIPVLSPYENETFTSLGSAWASRLPPLIGNCFAMTLMPVFGRWMILQRCNCYQWFVGKTIQTTRGMSAPNLAKLVYTELSELAKLTTGADVVYDFDRTIFSRGEFLSK